MQSSRSGADKNPDPERKKVKTGMTVQGIPAFKREPPLKEDKTEITPAPDEKKEPARDNYFVYDKELGRGGMGIVYKGRHVVVKFGKRIERDVAIKEIKYDDSEISSEPSLLEERKKALYDRFLEEVETVAKLKHRNIVDIRFFGETEDGRPFYVMEYLQGIDLQNHIYKRKTLGWDDIRPIITQTCAALIAAHEYVEDEGGQAVSRPIIHRDMKPANIFLTFDDEGKIERIVVLDFGLAKILTPRNPEDTFKGNAIDGTAEYMSPEQAFGLDLDHRSDIYSVGVMLYEMVSGSPPFAPSWKVGTDFHFELKPKAGPAGEQWTEHDELDMDDFVNPADWETFRNNRFYEFRDRLMQETPAPLPYVPEALARIIFRCLEKKPEGRYQSIRELKADIESLNGITWSWIGALPKPNVPAVDETQLPSVMVDPAMFPDHAQAAGGDSDKTALMPSPWAAHAAEPQINAEDLPSSHAPGELNQRDVKTQIVRVRNPDRDKPTMTIPKLASPKMPRRLAFAVLGVAGALAIGGATAAYFASRGGKEPEAAEMAPIPDAPQPDGSLRVIPTRPEAEPDARVAAPARQTFTITFKTNPSNVEILHGGQSVTCGGRQCDLTFEAADEPVELTFRKAGYRNRVERVVPNQNRTMRIRLERIGNDGEQGGGQRPIIITSPD